jgi:hypothetical protein
MTSKGISTFYSAVWRCMWLGASMLTAAPSYAANQLLTTTQPDQALQKVTLIGSAASETQLEVFLCG